MLRRLSIRLGAPAFPGSILRFTGEVTDVVVREAEQLVDVAFRADTAVGEHLSGTATLSLML
jgi:hypothetical protein